tara:strand:+ start:888 stop:1676 length:789 start_codon:yes stop_codon:yes gene_type:complete
MKIQKLVEISKNAQGEILAELSTIIDNHLLRHQNLSLNGLALKSGVSEPTLRRVRKREIKTLPKITTILDILSCIYKERNISDLIPYCQPATKSYLSDVFSVILNEESPYENDKQLCRELKDNTSYLIYKLAACRIGIRKEDVEYFFGTLGKARAIEMEKKSLIFEMLGFYHARTKSFRLDNDQFITNFKSVAEFIRVEEGVKNKDNIFYNLSESISEEAYKEVMAIQKSALKEIVKIFNDKKYAGDRPAFVLSAVDFFKGP